MQAEKLKSVDASSIFLKKGLTLVHSKAQGKLIRSLKEVIQVATIRPILIGKMMKLLLVLYT